MNEQILLGKIVEHLDGKVVEISSPLEITIDEKDSEEHCYYLYTRLDDFVDDAFLLSLCYKKYGVVETPWEQYRIKVGEETKIVVKGDEDNRYELTFTTRDKKEYEKQLEEKKKQEELKKEEARLQALRDQGGKELKGYKLLIKGTHSYQEPYGSGTHEIKEELAVIEGNRYPKYVSSEFNLIIKRVVDEETIVANDTEIKVGETREFADGGSHYSDDGPQYWSIKVEVSLVHKKN